MGIIQIGCNMSETSIISELPNFFSELRCWNMDMKGIDVLSIKEIYPSSLVPLPVCYIV